MNKTNKSKPCPYETGNLTTSLSLACAYIIPPTKALSLKQNRLSLPSQRPDPLPSYPSFELTSPSAPEIPLDEEGRSANQRITLRVLLFSGRA